MPGAIYGDGEYGLGIYGSSPTTLGISAVRMKRPVEPGALHLGLECVFELNGLVLHDRHGPFADTYQVTSIDGLRGGDIRLETEPKSGRHGERTKGEPLYGGKNVTMSGVIKASSITNLRQMEEDIYSAIGGLEEVPLKVRFWDWRDDFSLDRLATYEGYSNPTFLRVDLAVGGLVNDGAAEGYVLVPYRQYGDVQINSQHLLHGQSRRFNVLRENANGRLVVSCSSAAGLQILIDGAQVGSASGISIGTGERYWLVSSVIGDVVTGEVWGDDPNLGGEPEVSVTYLLDDIHADALGDGTFGSAGVGLDPNSSNDRGIVGEFRVNGIYPGDVQLNVIAGANPAIPESQTNDRPWRDFQLTLRADNPRLVNVVEQSASVVASVTTTKARVYPRTFPSSYSTILGADGKPFDGLGSVLSCENKGNFPAQTKVRFYGYMDSPELVHLETGERMALTGAVDEGNYIEVDHAAGTVRDSYGSNALRMYDQSSNELEVLSGPNSYLLRPSSHSGSAGAQIIWSNTWV